ncbi:MULTISPECIES: helix-turn-helix domain-containing protein [unclassified Streptomyces]|uniref:helix-turn-helix domain-containing protein n=1 Tax=unclassified Streptomyces TaxID=2593676 RepID=UPI000DAE6ADB|nr:MULTISPECIES: helix-turn-helix transcriptional regulator [unclassified Streptomyces]PZT72302.1 XRE family transcriptional regulator [Streptomyces sp. AC1-42T]PZT81375.1 XRE family transcriptional regulator [Streptomyces sp. AC1-42W]
MAVAKEIDASAGVPEFYGKELRYKREKAGLTLENLAVSGFCSISLLSEIEHGNRRMPPDLAVHMDRVLDTDGFFARRCEDVSKARRRGHAGYFERVLEAEKQALVIGQWSPTVIPGLVQTEPYIRELYRAERVVKPPEQIDMMVHARLKRAQLLLDQGNPEYWIVLPETLLWQPVLPPQQMAEQLEHVAGLARGGRIILQVVPWNTGAHALMHNNAMLLDFADAPPLFYTEGQYHGNTIDDPGIVKQYRRSYDLLRAAAMSPDSSLATVEAAIEDYRNGVQHHQLVRRRLAEE